MKYLIVCGIMLISSACMSVTVGKKFRVCEKWPDDPPIHFYDTDGPDENVEKEIFLTWWEVSCRAD